MKKVILSLGAVLAFGIASAQTDPQQIQPQTQSTTKTTIQQNDKTAVKGAVINNTKKTGADGEMVQPRKNELKTTDHIKSTPETTVKRDTMTTKQQINKARRTKKE